MYKYNNKIMNILQVLGFAIINIIVIIISIKARMHTIQRITVPILSINLTIRLMSDL